MPKTASLSHSHPSSGSVFKWSALISKRLGQISQWSDYSDFITDAVVSASSLTSFGEVNVLSRITHLAAFIRQVPQRSRTLCGVFREGSLKSRSGSRNWRNNVYSNTPAMLAGCPVNGSPSSGMRRSFFSWCYQDKITYCAQDLSKSAGTETIVLHSAFLWEEGVMCAISVKVHIICLSCTQQACEYCNIWLLPQWNCTGICLPLGSVTLTVLSLNYTQFSICGLIYIAEYNSENQKSLSLLWVFSPCH